MQPPHLYSWIVSHHTEYVWGALRSQEFCVPYITTKIVRMHKLNHAAIVITCIVITHQSYYAYMHTGNREWDLLNKGTRTEIVMQDGYMQIFRSSGRPHVWKHVSCTSTTASILMQKTQTMVHISCQSRILPLIKSGNFGVFAIYKGTTPKHLSKESCREAIYYDPQVNFMCGWVCILIMYSPDFSICTFILITMQ